MDKFKSAVILAGGKSSRMGFDKQFLKVKENKLMEIIVKDLEKEFQEIIIVTNKPENYIGSLYKVVCDEIKDKGPLGGLHIGLKESSSEYVYFIACDMPNINIDYIKYMKNQLVNKRVDACVTRVGINIEPFNSFYSKNITKDIEKHILKDKKSLNYFVKNLNTLYIEEEIAREFSENWNMFLNLNTIEDVNKYKKV